MSRLERVGLNLEKWSIGSAGPNIEMAPGLRSSRLPRSRWRNGHFSCQVSAWQGGQNSIPDSANESRVNTRAGERTGAF